MTNTIQEYLLNEEAQGFMHLGDLAEYGVAGVAPKGLIDNSDVIGFFDRYYSDIEAVVIDYVESAYGGTYYDLPNLELMDELRNDVLDFSTEDEMLEELQTQAYEVATDELAEEWDDMDEEEQEMAMMEAMEDLDVLPTPQDKIYFVWLAVELVAQSILDEREED